MAEKLTFLHAADLHLGAPFRGLRGLSPQWADRLAEAIGQAYDQVIDLAVERAVDFVIIAGDIFDQARASYADYARFFEGCRRLDAAGIPLYLCTGNHDPYTAWRRDFGELPTSSYLFSPEKPDFTLYRRDGRPLCVLGGRSYYNRVWSGDDDIAWGLTRRAADEALSPAGAQAPFGVGVLHTGLHLDPVKAPANPLELRHAGFDYWALGHIHMPWRDSETDPKLVFPGCIQGRDIRETGKRGVCLVTLEEGAPNRAEFVPTAQVDWELLQVDISECRALPDVVQTVMRRLFAVNGRACCEQMVTRITLTGTTPLHEVLRRPGLLEDLRLQLNDSYGDFFCDALLDATVLPIQKDVLREEGLFPSALLSASESLQADRAGQVAYLQEEFLRCGLPMPGEAIDSVDELAQQAENLVLDLLVAEDAR